MVGKVQSGSPVNPELILYRSVSSAEYLIQCEVEDSFGSTQQYCTSSSLSSLKNIKIKNLLTMFWIPTFCKLFVGGLKKYCPPLPHLARLCAGMSFLSRNIGTCDNYHICQERRRRYYTVCHTVIFWDSIFVVSSVPLSVIPFSMSGPVW